jgi:hypothetical protein
MPSIHEQVVTQYGDHDVPHVLEACERMEAHLTAAGWLVHQGLQVC